MNIYLLFCASTVSFASLAHAFTVPSPASSLTRSYSSLKLARNPEFSVVEEEDNDAPPADFTVLDTSDAEEETTPTSTFVASHHPQQRFEYAAVSPGAATSLKIQVGDIALARKAWKKRRRSGSPLLVPCSVLNIDRTSMLRGNMVYLMYKFGTPQKDGVVLSLAELKRRHKSHLKGHLGKHATALGYDGTKELVEALFEGKAMQDSWGARLLKSVEDDEIYLKSPLSKYRALQKANQATLLQVTGEEEESALDTMKHTGYIRCKVESEKSKKPYKFPPLSAAVRVSQKEVDSGKIQEGGMHPAVFFGFDDQGDGGSPLLTLSLNPARRPAIKRTAAKSGKVLPKYTPIRSPRHKLDDLHVGEGPFDATVVRLGKDHALVDFGVGRKFSKHAKADTIGTPEFVKVYGRLRFRDAIDPESIMGSNSNEVQSLPQQSAAEEEDVFASMDEMMTKLEDSLDQLEDGEEAEDISHLFDLKEDGSLSYSNPETGEIEIVKTDDDEDDAFEEEEEEEDEPVTFDVSDMSSHLRRLQKPRTLRLRVGDQVPIHILSVSKQSSQFMVTTDPSAVKGKKAKDIKKQSDASKKLERLGKMLGGLEKAEELKGRECHGTVKATSQTGDWLYVQPDTESEGNVRLPVGVATIPDELANENEFSQGDSVRIQLDGIDESRGQLAMHVIEKLAP